MYQFSRSMYRELASDVAGERMTDVSTNRARVLRSCEEAVERLATDPHYFARPARTLFNDIRTYFPVSSQRRVWVVVDRYMAFADEYFQRQPLHGFDINGNPLECRATTRKGTPCQGMPLPQNGYCPSHQHLVETEEIEVPAAASPELREFELAA